MTYEEQVEQGRTSPKGEVRTVRSYHKLAHIIIGVLILIGFVVGTYFLSEEETVIKESPINEVSLYQKFSLELENIKKLTPNQIEIQIEEFNSAYEEVDPFERDKIKTKLVHLKFQKEIFKLTEDNSNREARSELHRLKSIPISISLPEYEDKYKSPKDLYYGFFLNRNEVVVSQSPKNHYSNNGMLARDIATSGLPLEIHAPDLYNKEITWSIEAKNNLKGTGKSLIFTSDDGQYQLLVGHIQSWNRKTTAKTGEVIGIVGGKQGDTETGISTGRHLHVIHKFYDKHKEMFTPFIYDFGPMDWHPEVEPTAKEVQVVKQKSTDYSKPTFFTSYNPTVAQNDSTPCIGASGNVCENAKNGVRMIALSRDMLKPRKERVETDKANGYCKPGACKYSYGETVTLTTIQGTAGHGDWRCNGQFVVIDTMNKRFTNRGDIFFMNSKDNISCTAVISKT